MNSTSNINMTYDLTATFGKCYVIGYLQHRYLIPLNIQMYVNIKMPDNSGLKFISKWTLPANRVARHKMRRDSALGQFDIILKSVQSLKQVTQFVLKQYRQVGRKVRQTLVFAILFAKTFPRVKKIKCQSLFWIFWGKQLIPSSSVFGVAKLEKNYSKKFFFLSSTSSSSLSLYFWLRPSQCDLS